MEFFDVHFSYIDTDTNDEHFVTVKEQGGGSLIPDGPSKPGVLYTVAKGSGGMLGLYRLELQITPGGGKLSLSGLGSNSGSKESVKIAFDFLKANAGRVSASMKVGEHDFHLHIVELHNTGPTTALTLPAFLAFCSGLLGKPLQSQMIVLGDMSLGGTVKKAEDLASSLQVAFDAGGKRTLVPMASVGDIPSVPGELFAKFQTSFYAYAVDAAFNGMGVQ